MLELSNYAGDTHLLATEVDGKLEALFNLLSQLEGKRVNDRREFLELADEVRASNKGLSQDVEKLTEMVRALVDEGRGVLRVQGDCAEMEREVVYQEAQKAGCDKRAALKALSRARAIRDQGGKHTCVKRYGDSLKRVVVVYL